MEKCCICGKDRNSSGTPLWVAKSWLCQDCPEKAGGYAKAPIFGTIEAIRKAIEENQNHPERIVHESDDTIYEIEVV